MPACSDTELIVLNKPYGVICQFSPHERHPSLKDCMDVPGVYPAGRLDTDSEGLLLLTADGRLQAQIADPKHKTEKTYWVQVEGSPEEARLDVFRRKGYLIKRPGADWNMPTQRSMELGLFRIKETAVTHSDGHVSISKTPKVTGKGQAYFVEGFLSGRFSAEELTMGAAA